MTKEQAFAEINKTQDEYVNELINLINSSDYEIMKTINFTSPTGTGKTKMMSKLINLFPNYYFIVTTLSKGQLHLQIRNSLSEDCKYNNFYVYGSADYRINSKLDANDIIDKIPTNKKCIWLRDEGHIKTNRWDELLKNNCYKIINFSATNQVSDIKCNFTHTMMLRTVNQNVGTPEDAIKKLLEIKEIHKNISNYNPCAIFRCVGSNVYKNNLYSEIVNLCEKYNLKYIDLNEDDYLMAELCKDDNENDVIINKFKITEGIDIRRAHILYMDNQPMNNATTIQVIGRCRRNALLYRDDIDILAPENEKLLEQTRECFIYYNVDKMHIDKDENGELQYAFCNYISCEELKPNTTIEVINGQLKNGLHILELEEQTGTFEIKIDENTGFNVVEPLTDFYKEETNGDIYLYFGRWSSYSKGHREFKKVNIKNIQKFPIYTKTRKYNWEKKEYEILDCKPYYVISPYISQTNNYFVGEYQNGFDVNVDAIVSDKIIEYFRSIFVNTYTEEYIDNKLSCFCLDKIMVEIPYEENYMVDYINQFITQNKKKEKDFCEFLTHLERMYLRDFSLIVLKFYCILQFEKGISESYIETQAHRFLEFIYRYTKRNVSLFDFDIVVGTKEENKIKDEVLDNIYGLIPLLFDGNKFDDLEKKEIANNYQLNHPTLFVVKNYTDDKPIVNKNDIDLFFEEIELVLNGKVSEYKKSDYICQKEYLFISSEYIKSKICGYVGRAFESLKNHKIPEAYISYLDLFEKVTEEELNLLKKGLIKYETMYFDTKYSRLIIYQKIEVSQLKKYNNKNYTIVNDKESAIIGVDLMQQIKRNDGVVFWTESKSVTSKIGNNSKLNRFISQRYSKELEQVKSLYFSGKNEFDLDTKQNSMIGYCVEYYSKYLLYGEEYLGDYLKQAKYEYYRKPKTQKELDFFIIRACMFKYKEMMMLSFGEKVAKRIQLATIENLMEDRYFVGLIVELGTRTAEYVKKTLYPDGNIKNNVDANLSIKHISGLADYITHDTILDVKVLNHITERNIRQVLAYHYLSTKRSDLDIKRVIVYDATSDKAIEVKIENG